MSETTLCDECGRIAYVDEQRHCDLCGDIICSRRCCTKNHRRAIPVLTPEGWTPRLKCTIGPGLRRTREAMDAFVAAGLGAK